MASNSEAITKKSNLNKIQTLQNKILPSITNAPPYISNVSLHLKIKTIHEESKMSYERIFNKLPSHSNPLISGKPLTRVFIMILIVYYNVNFVRDLLND